MLPRRCTPSSIRLTAAALLAVPLALGFPAGCGSAPQVQTAPTVQTQISYPIEPEHARELGYDVRWAHSLPLERGQSVTHVFEDAGTLLAIEQPVNVVTALDPASGTTLWKTVVGSRLETVVGMTSDERSVYINTTTRMFQLARRGGAVKRIMDLQYPVNGSPLKVGRLAIFGADVGHVFAHHLDDGYSKWAYSLGSAIQTTPTLSSQDAFVVDSAGQYAMLDVASGKLLWRGRLYGGVSAAPAVHEGFVLVASEDQSLYSLGEVNGKDRWPAFRSEARLTTPPLARGSLIFLNEPGVGLSSITARTGERNWLFSGDVVPFADDGSSLIAHGEDSLLAIDPANGTIRRSVPTKPLLAARSDDRGHLLLASATGGLIRISPAGAAPTGAVVVQAPAQP